MCVGVTGTWRWSNEARTAPLKVVNISNFEEGVELQAGDQFTGILAFDSTLNLARTVTVINGQYRYDFLFPSNPLTTDRGASGRLTHRHLPARPLFPHPLAGSL